MTGGCQLAGHVNRVEFPYWLMNCRLFKSTSLSLGVSWLFIYSFSNYKEIKTCLLTTRTSICRNLSNIVAADNWQCQTGCSCVNRATYSQITEPTQNGALVELCLEAATERHVAVWEHDQD